MSAITMKTPAEAVAEYLKFHGYAPLRMDIYGLTAKGYWEFAVNPDGSFAESRGADGRERLRTWREWKDPEHGKWVERKLK